VALQLKRAGVRKVRPLEGGFDAWRKLGLPTEEVTAAHLDEVEASMSQAE
jgi:3-mercaptopyruvate sulfurtransferase SseA